MITRYQNGFAARVGWVRLNVYRGNRTVPFRAERWAGHARISWGSPVRHAWWATHITLDWK